MKKFNAAFEDVKSGIATLEQKRLYARTLRPDHPMGAWGRFNQEMLSIGCHLQNVEVFGPFNEPRIRAVWVDFQGNRIAWAN